MASRPFSRRRRKQRRRQQMINMKMALNTNPKIVITMFILELTTDLECAFPITAHLPMPVPHPYESILPTTRKMGGGKKTH
jgi:hypothetical protein